MMGFLAPLIVSAFFLGYWALFAQESTVTAINPTQAQNINYGQEFLAYRNAVMTFQTNHPTHRASVSITAIAGVVNNSFSSNFLSKVGNIVLTNGVGNGRVVICYGAFPQSVATQAAIAANNDASFGVSNGSTWTSAAVGASSAAIALATPITSGYIVSVIQLDL